VVIRNIASIVVMSVLAAILLYYLLRHGESYGPHHEAQKSVRTGTLLSRMISLNCSSLTSIGSPIAGNSALQAPHLPTSERCLAGMRLDLPQEGQFRISGMDLF